MHSEMSSWNIFFSVAVPSNVDTPMFEEEVWMRILPPPFFFFFCIICFFFISLFRFPFFFHTAGEAEVSRNEGYRRRAEGRTSQGGGQGHRAEPQGLEVRWARSRGGGNGFFFVSFIFQSSLNEFVFYCVYSIAHVSYCSRHSFFIPTGTDPWLVANITAGFAPASFLEFLTQPLLACFGRFVVLAETRKFRAACRLHYNQSSK
jgi:hypothetical protein